MTFAGKIRQLKKTLRLFSGLLRGEEYSRFILAETVCRMIYPRYKFSEYGRVFLEDSEFLAWYRQRVSQWNFHSLDRKFTLRELLGLVRQVPGDTAECGVFQGASSQIICQQCTRTGKHHHVFDSFEGISIPELVDGNSWQKGDLCADEETVRQNLQQFSDVHYYRGWIPERFPETAGTIFSFVHIDVDLYQPTKASVEFFYGRLAPGGIMLFDDYGFRSCPGARLAIDEFFRQKPEPVIRLTTGQAFVIKR